RSPATAEIEDRHAVLDARARTRELEHRVLRVRERGHAAGPEARRVLQPWPEHEPEELRRHLVVLLVRLRRLMRDRLVAQRGDERFLAVETALAAETRRARRADAGAQQRLRHATGLDQAVDDFGNHGTNALVSRW